MFAVAELNGHLDLKSKYIYTNGMLVGKITSDDELFQYFHDGLGSITMIIDSTGSYQNLYTYDDFGDFRSKTESVANSYYYTGQERDEEPSGLYNLRARYYAAGMGRFTQEDPVFGMKNISSSCHSSSLSPLVFDEPQLINPYLYVTNNPIVWVDITGLVLAPPGYKDPCKMLGDCLEDVDKGKSKASDKCNQNKKECLRFWEKQERCKEYFFNIPAFDTHIKFKKAQCWEDWGKCSLKAVGGSSVGYSKCWAIYGGWCLSDLIGVSYVH